jgi:protein O-GlcNAc transferase
MTAGERPLEAAIQEHRAGRVAEAARLYDEILASDPRQAQAAFLRGVLALEAGELEKARDLFARALSVAPDHAAYLANLGETQRRLKQFGPAADALLKAVVVGPDAVAPAYNLGLLLEERGAFEGAAACFARARELKADLAGIGERIARVRSRVLRRSSAPSRRAGTTPEDALSATALVALATTLVARGRPAPAVDLLLAATAMNPQSAPAHGTLGTAYGDLQRFDEAIAAYERALAIDPERPELRAMLADLLCRSGRIEEGVAEHRRAAAMADAGIAVGESLLFALHFDPACDAATLLEEARAWDARYCAPLATHHAKHENEREPGRKLRVGYVGADFRQHCQAFFLFPLLAHHARKEWEVFCYANVSRPDDWTEQLRRSADGWCDIAGMDDARVAERIFEDRVDVLVDLTMHMHEGRLGVFARKPAPVQICWLAYPGTTGLAAMDYRLTDRFLDPPGSDLAVYAERSLVLPDTFWCYHPLTSEDGANPLPAAAGGRITFGCLNNFCKVNAGTIALWARVLREVPRSQLLLLAPPGEARVRTANAFAAYGIERDRIEFVGHQARLPYLATYRRIDVCLDTFPYSGHTTSLDAFWMGVPVVTLTGRSVVGRAGLSQAMNLGLPELVADTPDDFVRVAAGLAGDLDRLTAMRAGLRARMEASPLMDAPRFARNIEAAFREAWTAWCEHG